MPHPCEHFFFLTRKSLPSVTTPDVRTFTLSPKKPTRDFLVHRGNGSKILHLWPKLEVNTGTFRLTIIGALWRMLRVLTWSLHIDMLVCETSWKRKAKASGQSYAFLLAALTHWRHHKCYKFSTGINFCVIFHVFLNTACYFNVMSVTKAKVFKWNKDKSHFIYF